MPQNPLDILRNLAMRNVPQPTRPSTEMEVENQDFRAAAMQEQDPIWKKVGRNALDAITGFVAGDPFAEGVENESWGSKLGMLAGAAPALGSLKNVPKLPVIAPEAYQHVKADGLKLYSRLTDTFAKAPKQMMPDKVRSLAKQGAAAEEIKLRRLEEFLGGRPPMQKIPQEEIMRHLEANPLELNIARKTEGGIAPERRAYNEFIHQMDTKYGQGWITDTQSWDVENGPMPPRLNPEEFQQWRALSDAEANVPLHHDSSVGYDTMQTGGRKENYGETLINLPDPETSKLSQAELLSMYKKRYASTIPEIYGDAEWTAKIEDFRDTLAKENTFTSSHWHEPNNLVWSRHNDRWLGPSKEQELEYQFSMADTIRDAEELRRVPVTDPRYNEMYEATRAARAARAQLPLDYDQMRFQGPKGRFVEEIQSDWHQAGREIGYNTPEEQARRAAARDDIKAKYQALEDYVDAELAKRPDLAHAQNYEPRAKMDALYWGKYNTPETEEVTRLRSAATAADQHWNDNFSSTPVPDAPYKDTYHELALKQQLLDAANDPELQWLGVADSDTAQMMEGHIYQPGQIHGRREGMDLYYNEKHPSALEKLLKPMGGKVEYDNLPGSRIYAVEPHTNSGFGTERPRVDVEALSDDSRPHRWEPVASTVLSPFEGDIGKAHFQGQEIADTIKKQGNMIPGPGFWKAKLTPEMKQTIKDRGFPAMAALLALQSQRDRFNNGEQ